MEIDNVKSTQITNNHWLKAAQLGWIVLAVLSLLALVASLPGQYTAEVASYDSFDPQQLLIFPGVMSVVVPLGLAVLLFLQRRDDRMALFLAYFFLLFGVAMTGPLYGIALFIGSDEILYIGYALLTIPFVLLLFVFPTGTFVPSWSRWFVPVVVLIAFPTEFFRASPGGTSQRIVSNIGEIMVVLMILTGLGGQIYRYRRLSSPGERLQVKWVLYGFGIFFITMLISSLPYSYLQSLPPETPEPWWALPFSALWVLGLMAVPISFTVSILRYRLWDIDFIIRRTIVYGLLTALLLAIYFGSVVLTQTLLAAVSGQRSPVAIVISTLLIAALFQPLRQRIQGWIDRRFFRSKYDAAKTLHSFAETARDEVDLEQLSMSLMRAVNETLRPQQAWLWLKQIQLPEDEN